MIKYTLFVIFLLGFLLRFYQLGTNPPSLDWDEASLGYNAYSILKTGADEYGNKLPVAIRSFDDYKPALYVYLLVPVIAIFGLTEFAVRFPSALLGSLAILATYFLVFELFKKRNLALLSAFLLSISPWHLQFSRIAFEANISLFFFILGNVLFLKSMRRPWFLILSFVSFVLSLYAYHSVRLVLPLFLIGIFFYFRKELYKEKKYFLIAALVAVVLCLPLLGSFLGNGGASRFSSVTILNPTGTLDYSIKQLELDRQRGDILGELFHNRRVVYSLAVLKGYLDHYNPEFLFLRGDGISRHHAVDMGMLYLFELPFVFLGIYFLLAKKMPKNFVLFWWFLVAPAASAITTGTPHPVRALLMLPTFQIFSAAGTIFMAEYIRMHYRFWWKYIYVILSLFFIFNVVYYFHQYYVNTPLETSQGWQYGYRQVFEEIRKIEDRYDKIIVTYEYDQPYVFYLFYNKIDPGWYQTHWDTLGNGQIERSHRVIGKYEFRNIDFAKDQSIPRVLLVGTPQEVPDVPQKISEIKFLDGEVAFRIVGK